MIAHTPHVHILDIADGDWGAHPDKPTAKRAARRTLRDFNEFADQPMTMSQLTIVPSTEWCGDDPDPCYYEVRKALLDGMRKPPLWTWDCPPLTSAVYRIDGRRVARWRMACSMTIDTAMELWPFRGHPVALPHWQYETVMADSGLCGCRTRQHRAKGCIIGPNGRKCSICQAVYQDYGNGFSHCLPCQDWLDRREAYLADWAAQHTQAAVTAQPALL